jgi:hypothetical protein
MQISSESSSSSLTLCIFSSSKAGAQLSSIPKKETSQRKPLNSFMVTMLR